MYLDHVPRYVNIKESPRTREGREQRSQTEGAGALHTNSRAPRAACYPKYTKIRRHRERRGQKDRERERNGRWERTTPFSFASPCRDNARQIDDSIEILKDTSKEARVSYLPIGARSGTGWCTACAAI